MAKGIQKSKGNMQNNQLQEPETAYLTTDKVVISSTEAQDEDNYCYWASLTPKQRLELHYQMITHIYSNELKESRPYNEQPIHFD
jgi:pectin methylesterase-like acyl-CoA thioesterase